MKKMAVYTEGGTELGFVERLLLEIAGEKNIQIVTQRRTGGGHGGTRSREIVAIKGSRGGHDYYAQIVNCTNDERVCSDLRGEYNNLVAQGFCAIVGMRDARGESIPGRSNTLADVPKMKAAIRKYIRTDPVDLSPVLRRAG
jgi:hypothetical protein